MSTKDNLKCPECGKNIKTEEEIVYPFQCLNCGTWLSYIKEKGKIEVKRLSVFKK